MAVGWHQTAIHPRVDSSNSERQLQQILCRYLVPIGGGFCWKVIDQQPIVKFLAWWNGAHSVAPSVVLDDKHLAGTNITPMEDICVGPV